MATRPTSGDKNRPNSGNQGVQTHSNLDKTKLLLHLLECDNITKDVFTKLTRMLTSLNSEIKTCKTAKARLETLPSSHVRKACQDWMPNMPNKGEEYKYNCCPRLKRQPEHYSWRRNKKSRSQCLKSCKYHFLSRSNWKQCSFHSGYLQR
jgi:hypothetical protein